MQIYFCSVIMKNMYYKSEVNLASSLLMDLNKKEQYSYYAALLIIFFR